MKKKFCQSRSKQSTSYVYPGYTGKELILFQSGEYLPTLDLTDDPDPAAGLNSTVFDVFERKV